jgi:hypothetical protein
MAKHPKTNTASAEKRRPGRPRSSPLDPIEQARVRRQRHRESKRNAGVASSSDLCGEYSHQAIMCFFERGTLL